MVNVKEYPLYFFSYSMEIKEQTRKLAAGCSKHCFEVVDRTDEVSSKHCFEVADRTDEVSNHIYGNVTLTWFEEIFEEYYISKGRSKFTPTC
ncbi:chlorohydrolase [Streptococcus pneumoniae]|nr:chlorohydrolase [Streptococcus pneumoniae]